MTSQRRRLLRVTATDLKGYSYVYCIGAGLNQTVSFSCAALSRFGKLLVRAGSIGIARTKASKIRRHFATLSLGDGRMRRGIVKEADCGSREHVLSCPPNFRHHLGIGTLFWGVVLDDVKFRHTVLFRNGSILSHSERP